MCPVHLSRRPSHHCIIVIYLCVRPYNKLKTPPQETMTKLLQLSSLLLSISTSLEFANAFVGTTSVSSSSPTRELHAKSSHHHHESEFEDLFQDYPQKHSYARRTRLAREEQISKRFATGEELENLRMDLESLRHNLQWAEALSDEGRVASLKKAIRNGENRDPNLMYTKALKEVNKAKFRKNISQDQKDALIEKWTKVAAAARECLPQFSLEGLWVGK